MANINFVIVTGNLTSDVEIKQVGDNKCADLSIGVNIYKGKNADSEVAFVPFTLWNQQAERLQGGLKGDYCEISGQLRMNSYTDKETGKQRTSLYVYPQTVNDLDLQRRNKEQGGNGQYQQPYAQQAPQGMPPFAQQQAAPPFAQDPGQPQQPYQPQGQPAQTNPAAQGAPAQPGTPAPATQAQPDGGGFPWS